MRNHVGAAKNYIAMQHAEVRKQRRKLIANERCESARIIERVGCCLDSLPGRFRQIQAMGFVGAEVRVPECSRVLDRLTEFSLCAVEGSTNICPGRTTDRY